MITSRERVLTAVGHGVSDRTPITFDASEEMHAVLYKHFGVKSRPALFDRLHCDTWLITPGVAGPGKKDEQGRSVNSLWGWKSVEVKYPGGAYTELAWSPFAGQDDPAVLDRHEWPTPAKQDYSRFREGVATGTRAGRAVIASACWGAYFISSMLRGMEDIMMDFAANAAFLEKMLGIVAERTLEMQRHMLEQYGEGIDILYMADDYCSQRSPLFSPEDFRRFIVPYLKRSVELAHRHNKKFLLHCCGAVRPLLPAIIECGVDMLEPIQVRAEGMEPAGLKRDFGRDLCFYGGLDLQQVLCKGSEAEVRDEVRRLIDVLGKDGGYVFGPGHTYIQIDAPLRNVLAMYEEAGQTGVGVGADS